MPSAVFGNLNVSWIFSIRRQTFPLNTIKIQLLTKKDQLAPMIEIGQCHLDRYLLFILQVSGGKNAESIVLSAMCSNKHSRTN